MQYVEVKENTKKNQIVIKDTELFWECSNIFYYWNRASWNQIVQSDKILLKSMSGEYNFNTVAIVSFSIYTILYSV